MYYYSVKNGLLLMVFTIYMTIIGCGSSPESLRKEWYKYSSSKLEEKMSDIINQRGWFKNTIYDNDKGLQWSFSSGTYLQFLSGGSGRIIVEGRDAFGTVIARDWVSGKWWIQQSPSANGVLADEIVFKADNARDGLKMDPTNLPDNLAFIDLVDFFSHNKVPWFSVNNYLEFADDLRFDFMKEKNIIFSKEEGFVSGDNNSPFILYWPDGKVRVKGEYRNGKKHGDWNWLWHNGNKYASGQYLKGKKAGVWLHFNPSSGDSLLLRYFNEKEELHGDYVEFNAGLRKKEGSYKNGKKDGEWFLYKEDGSHFKRIYDNNENSGIWVHYSADGDTMGIWNTNILTEFYGVWGNDNNEQLTINRYKEMRFGKNSFPWEAIYNSNGNEIYWKENMDESSILNHRIIFETIDGEKRIKVTGGEKGHYTVNNIATHPINYSDYVGIYQYNGEPAVDYDIQDLLFGKWSDGLVPEVIYEFMSGDDPRVKKYKFSSEYIGRYAVMVTFNKNDKKKFKNKMETDIRTLPKEYIDWYNNEYVDEILEIIEESPEYGFKDDLVIDTTIYSIGYDGSSEKSFETYFSIRRNKLEIVSISKDEIVTLADWGGGAYKEYIDAQDELDDIVDDITKLCYRFNSKLTKYYEKLEKIYLPKNQFETIYNERECRGCGEHKVKEESKAQWKRKHKVKYENLVSECVSLLKTKNELTDILQKKVTYTLTRIE